MANRRQVAFVAARLALNARLEMALAQALRREFALTARQVARAYRSGAEVEAEFVRHQSRLVALMQRFYARGLALAWSQWQSGVQVSSGRKEEPVPEPVAVAVPPPDAAFPPGSGLEDVDPEIVRELVFALAQLKGEQLSEVTKTQVLNAIADGLIAGMTVEKIAALIEERTGGKVADVRAARIARTEVTTVTNAADNQLAQREEIEYGTWYTSLDARVRPTHADAHGQRIRTGTEDQFLVGNARLRFPGDPWGPPEEIINCRCVVLYERA